MENNYHELHSGELYNPNNEAFTKEQQIYKEKLHDFNLTRPGEEEKRNKILKELVAELGEGTYIEPPLRANWGGKHVHFGNDVYVNFNLTLVDDTHIYIGDNVMIGPNVVINSGTHPISPSSRKEGMQYNLPVHIDENVWIGSGVQILPGVHIGKHSVIGSGSVVTKDIPDNVVAVGVPCKVVREIDEENMK